MNKLDRLDIKQLRVFQALIREQSASKAASQLGLTQQAVSEQLKKLRDVFGDRLFLRKTNGFIPTPLAEELSLEIDKLLRDFQALLSPKAFNPTTVEGSYVIAATRLCTTSSSAIINCNPKGSITKLKSHCSRF